MVKYLIKYAYYVLLAIFITSIISVIFIREHLENDLLIDFINYFFWYSFGLYSGALIAKKVIKKYNEIIKE